MNALEEQTIACPYCGEAIDILLDCSVPHQRYVEDCQVCCRPIDLDVTIADDGGAVVAATTDRD